MKLFGEFEAVKFTEENLILITHNCFLYFIYDPENNIWRKHRNAGYDYITTSHYTDVSKEELTDAMGGLFPEKETDFLRLLLPRQLSIRDMMDLLEEDYPDFMSDITVYYSVRMFLRESVIIYKSYLKLKKVFDDSLALQENQEQILGRIKELSLDIIGRDIYKREIRIVDGHDSSSYFWIMPIRVIDYTNTDEMDNVAAMESAEISIEEDDIDQYLTPFLYQYFDDKLEANRQRKKDDWIDDDGTEHATYITGFEWNLTHNFYTYDSIMKIIKDISRTIDALSSGRENEFTAKLREKRGFATSQLVYAKNLSEEQIKEYNENRPTIDDTAVELIIDFYYRFIYRMEYMMKVGKEKGYDLISFMGP